MKLRFSYVDGGAHPKLGRVYYWWPEVLPEEGYERYVRYLSGVLSAVAQVPSQCDRLLKYIDDIEVGIESKIIGGGNDVELTFSKTGVQVDILINDDWCGQPEGHFQLHDWKVALKAWRHFLTLPESLETVVEVDI